jgi:membrane associated rhomboid family serine protease
MTLGLNLILIIITVIISFSAFNRPELAERLKFNAYRIRHAGESWRFLTYALVHADWLHLLVNMYVLYAFGRLVEQAFITGFGNIGYLYYGLLYIGGVIFSTLFDFGKNKENPYYNAVGASGAVSAVLFASILLHPFGSIFIFPIPFSIPSWVFGILYIIYSAYMGRRGKDNIGHNAHLWGAIFGLVFTIILIPGSVGQLITYLFG